MASKLKVQEQEAVIQLAKLKRGIREIARKLGLSRNTVRTYVRAFRKANDPGVITATILESATSTSSSPPLQTDPLSTAGTTGRKSLCSDQAGARLPRLGGHVSASG